MSRTSSRVCSITDALAIVGDRYALLVAREIRYGNTHFNEIAAGTGAPRDVLTRRLRALEQAGVVERRRYSDHPPRDEYLLTDAGNELHPILLALKEWCGAEFHPVSICEACGQPVRLGELTVAGGTHPVDATL